LAAINQQEVHVAVQAAEEIHDPSEAGRTSFSPALFTFLRELRTNNRREWFDDNRGRYEEAVREPALDFIQDFEPLLHDISPHLVADPRPVGGSLFRIHRDVRFSKDKSPYKTQAGIRFRHELARDVHAPGLYLHLEPGGCFAGVGVWHPDGETLAKVRAAIAADPSGWKRAAHGGRFAATYRLAGDSLKRPPAGFDADHPFIEDLKRKDFIGVSALSQRSVTGKGFREEYARICRDAVPFMRFLCRAIGVPF
jgi:uncharacterized protein (TIGR02453 family)